MKNNDSSRSRRSRGSMCRKRKGIRVKSSKRKTGVVKEVERRLIRKRARKEAKNVARKVAGKVVGGVEDGVPVQVAGGLTAGVV